jgi:hypothetical protein
MPYFVSRQKYWPEGDRVVEVAGGGLDYANPDMLVEAYPDLGEGKEYIDPREAVKAAISIRDAWKIDTPYQVRVEVGYTGGWTMPFAEEPTDEELLEWAENQFQDLEKCDACGIVLEDGRLWGNELSPDSKFCSETCADEDYHSVQDLLEKCTV